MTQQHVMWLLIAVLVVAIVFIMRNFNSANTWVDVVMKAALVGTGLLVMLAAQ
jgi:hypothetical protein